MPQKEHSSATAWTTGVIVVLVIYAVFPVVWIWPLFHIYGNTPPEWCLVVVSPLIWLRQNFPGYEEWVELQARVIGIVP